MADTAFRMGEIVEPRTVLVPSRTTLTGRTVSLVPLDPDAHAAALFEATHGPDADPQMWDYMAYGPFEDVADLARSLRQFAVSDDPLWFAFLDNATGQPIGAGGYLRIDTSNRVIEIGHLLFGSAMQRSTMATETIFLLIRHAFALGYRRVEWKCNGLNERSKRAALRFGFTFEGTFRRHMIVKGHNRDTAWFAITDGDWPRIERAFESWLAPENFDGEGKQRQRLDTAIQKTGE